MDPLLAEAIFAHQRTAALAVSADLRVCLAGGEHSVLGCDPYQAKGRDLVDLVPELHGSEAVLCAIASGSQASLELPRVNRVAPDGGTAYLFLTVLPWRQAPSPAGVLVLIEDMTEAGRVEQALVQRRNELSLLNQELGLRNADLAAANAELERTAVAKSDFVSTVAHELRAPLTAITGYLELLLEGAYGALNPTQGERLRMVEQSAQRLGRIVNDLLDVTRIELGHLTLLLQPISLLGLAEAVVAEQLPQLAARGQRAEILSAPGLPQVLCDGHRAAQVLSNLVSNANKYSPAGSTITVGLACAEEAGYVRVSVSDEGPGIAADERERIFARSFRGAAAHAADVQGSGLGLSIARALVELHGGHIWFETEVGCGSVFAFTLPMADAPRAPAGALIG